MKVYFEKNITAISGKDLAEKVIFSSINDGNLCYARKYVRPRETEQNINFGLDGQKIKEKWAIASSGFKNDLKKYGELAHQGEYWKQQLNNYSVYCKAVFAKAADLGTEVRELADTVFTTGSISTVKNMQDAGYLPAVAGGETLTQPFTA